MSLLKNYSISNDQKENFIVDFTTTENVSVNYKTERDGTNVITITPDALGDSSFSKNYGIVSDIKFAFEQPETNNRTTLVRKPAGEIFS